MKSPAISVMIPVYNSESFLRRCVDSATAQTFRDIEILLIDDGSTDSSGQLCDALARTDNRIRVIHRKNGGVADARNTGLDHARGEYLIFLDSDDYIDADMLETLYGLALKYETKIAACTIADHFKAREIKEQGDKVYLLSPQEMMKNILLRKMNNYSVCTKLIHRDLCKSHRFCTGKTYEDVRYMPGLLLQVERIALIDRPMYHYWHRSGSICSSAFSEDDLMHIEAHQYVLEQVREHWPSLEDIAVFRCRWAQFLLLDKLLMSPAPANNPLLRQTVSDLRRSWKEIVSCPYFQLTRRASVLALKLGVPCYRLLLLLHNRSIEVNA